MDADQTPAGPAGSLLQSIVRLAGNLLAAVETRVDLFATELREDGERGMRLLAWAIAALMLGIFAVLLAGVTVIIAFWDTYRIAAAIGVTAVFVAAAIACGLVVRRHLRERPRLLDATRGELRKDVAALRSNR
jgi:uncharacterized membrane protein YqjE